MAIQKLGRALLVMAFSALPIACGPPAGAAFVGQWRDIQAPQTTYEIRRNGKGFLLTQTGTEWSAKRQIVLPATVSGDTLVVVNGFAPVTLAIDHATGNLMVGSKQAKRVP